jgi:hypothetical protein
MSKRSKKDESVFSKIADKTVEVAQKVGNTLESSLANYLKKHREHADKKESDTTNIKAGNSKKK